MSAETSLHDVLTRIASCEGMKSPKFQINNADDHGYVAIVSKVTVTDEESPKKVALFVKQTPQVMKLSEFVYFNEADFYLKTWKAFQELANELDTELPTIPKCYHASRKMIVMEDLTQRGFQIWTPLIEPLDHRHIEATLKTYAKFHAYSFAFKYRHPEVFTTLGRKYETFLDNYEELTHSGYFQSFTEKVLSAFEPGSTYYQGFLNFMNNGWLKYLQEVIKSNQHDVIVHGDCWTHNFMYKYSKTNNQITVALLDFQLKRLTALARDLSYFFTTSACCQHVFDNLEQYLHFYYERLAENLTQLKCPREIFDFEAFKHDWRRFSVGGLILGLVVNKMIVAIPEELDARKEMTVLNQFDFISVNEHLYHDRVRIIVKYFCDANILSQWK